MVKKLFYIYHFITFGITDIFYLLFSHSRHSQGSLMMTITHRLLVKL